MRDAWIELEHRENLSEPKGSTCSQFPVDPAGVDPFFGGPTKQQLPWVMAMAIMAMSYLVISLGFFMDYTFYES